MSLRESNDVLMYRASLPPQNPWEVEKLELGEDWANRVDKREKFLMKFQHENTIESIKFKRNDVIW